MMSVVCIAYVLLVLCTGKGIAEGVPHHQVRSSSEQYRIDTTLMGRVMYRFVRNIREEVKRLMK